MIINNYFSTNTLSITYDLFCQINCLRLRVENLYLLYYHCPLIDEGDSAGGNAVTEDAQARNN